MTDTPTLMPHSDPAPTDESGQRNGLRITEIFHSLQGESITVGVPTVFVRLTGCPLRCVWCDSAYAFGGGQWMRLDEIIEQVLAYGCQHVTITGGEPLSQKRCLDLLRRLADAGLSVSLETSGAIDLSEVDARISRVMDLKPPDSGEVARNLWSNMDLLTPHDQLKFVIASRGDYEWACEVLDRHVLPEGMPVLLSPVHGQLSPKALAEWILEDRRAVRMQMQMHKLIWGDRPGH